jgi:hypothetical protein
MKQYTVIRDFWRNGILQTAGSLISMIENEAKYLAHVIEEKVEEVEAKVVAVVQKARAPKPAGVAVAEAPANGDQHLN